MFYGRLRQACAPTGAAQTHNGVATLSRYYTPPPLISLRPWVCGGCSFHLDLPEVSSVSFQARSLSSPVAGALCPPRRQAFYPPRRQVFTILLGGRRSLSSPEAGVHCPPRQQVLFCPPRRQAFCPPRRQAFYPPRRQVSLTARWSFCPPGRWEHLSSTGELGSDPPLSGGGGGGGGGGAGTLGSLLVYPHRQCVVTWTSGRLRSRMGHAYVMSTLPRSPADRTNNSITHLRTYNIYMCITYPECSTAGCGRLAPRPARPRHTMGSPHCPVTTAHTATSW